MASLQRQLCEGVSWLWRNPPEHELSFISSWELWQMYWAFSPGALTSQWGFYGSIVNIFQYWLWSTSERALRNYVCFSWKHTKNQPIISEMIRNVSRIYEWHRNVFWHWQLLEWKPPPPIVKGSYLLMEMVQGSDSTRESTIKVLLPSLRWSWKGSFRRPEYATLNMPFWHKDCRHMRSSENRVVTLL